MSAYSPCPVAAATIRALHGAEIDKDQALQILGILEDNQADSLEDYDLTTLAIANRIYGILTGEDITFYYNPSGRYFATPPGELARLLIETTYRP